MAEETPYLTIKQSGSSTQTIKKSEFICHIKRTTSQTEAEQFIEQINTEHKKATHNCYAFMLGDDDHIQRASDNGEPSGTAGVPILEVLKNNHLHDVCAVVTRYFGGIKLGAGGLIRAYSSTTAQAIKELGIAKKVPLMHVTLNVSYNQWDKLQNYFANNPDITVKTPTYTENITVGVLIQTAQLVEHKNAITQLLAAKMEWSEDGVQTAFTAYHPK